MFLHRRTGDPAFKRDERLGFHRLEQGGLEFRLGDVGQRKGRVGERRIVLPLMLRSGKAVEGNARLRVDARRQHAELEARVPGVFLPEPGSRVTVNVNANQAHVFPVDDD